MFFLLFIGARFVLTATNAGTAIIKRPGNLQISFKSIQLFSTCSQVCALARRLFFRGVDGGSKFQANVWSVGQMPQPCMKLSYSIHFLHVLLLSEAFLLGMPFIRKHQSYGDVQKVGYRFIGVVGISSWFHLLVAITLVTIGKKGCRVTPGTQDWSYIHEHYRHRQRQDKDQNKGVAEKSITCKHQRKGTYLPDLYRL